MTIAIMTLAAAQRHKREFDAVISIEDPDVQSRGLRFHQHPRPQHLVLQFADLDDPVPEPFAHRAVYRMATIEQINDALSFAHGHENVLIHCPAGIGRSPALALGILAQRLEDEAAAFKELERIRPEAVPNRHVLRLVDDLLGTRLSARIGAWDARDEWKTHRRLMCRRAYFLDGGIPLEPALEAASPIAQFLPAR